MALVAASQTRYTKDPWERPLRFVQADKLKRQAATEKEARLLVACYQGREDEVAKIFKSGKPQPRADSSAQTKEEHEYRPRGKANRAPTKIAVSKFAKQDLYRYGSPLHKAALRGDGNIIEMLLENMKEAGRTAIQLLDEKTEVGNTPLHCAAYRGHVDVCEVLLDALSDVQVDVNPKTGQKAGNCELTVNGSLAAIACRNQYLSTPMDKAREANQKAVLRLLEAWPERLKKRNEATTALREKLDMYKKDIYSLKKQGASTELRAMVLDAEKASRPRVKKKILDEAKALLMRAE